MVRKQEGQEFRTEYRAVMTSECSLTIELISSILKKITKELFEPNRIFHFNR